MAWSEWKKFGGSLENAEFYASKTTHNVGSNATATHTISTDKTSFDIIVTASALRSSRTTGGTLDITSGYATKELLAESSEVSKMDGITIQKIYHIEKESTSDLTITFKNTQSDYSGVVINAIIVG